MPTPGRGDTHDLAYLEGDDMAVAVIGTGHVGLITAVSMAILGHRVIATDIDREKIERMSRGEAPFFEPGLEEALEAELGTGRLRFTTDAAEAVEEAEVVFLCVGTPPRHDGEANLIALEHSATVIARGAKRDPVVVEKSTVPAGTADRLRLTLTLESGGRRFEVVSNPEFLREGTALADSLHPDRIVVGAESDRGRAVMQRLYAPLTARGCPLLETDIPTAELAKHASNAFLALKISFANALARISERAGADISSVVEVMGADPRIGRAFLSAGLGYGGFCFPKDVAALERLAARLGYDFPLLREVARLNDEAIETVVHTIQEALWNLDGKRVAVLGLAFKPGTDDVRFSPALALSSALLDAGAIVVGYDPQADRTAKEELPRLEIAGDPYEAATGAHCVVLSTDWDEFRLLDLARLRAAMVYPVLVDGRNMLDPDEVTAAGLAYHGMGKPPRRSAEPAASSEHAVPGEAVGEDPVSPEVITS
jgi:UDPglucose 6-dehydrogenase